MRKSGWLIVCLFFFIFSEALRAQLVPDLTVGTVAVSSRSQQALAKAAPQALRQVLIKLTGNPNIMTNSVIRSSLSQAEQWMQTFSYATQQVGDQPQLIVSIHFDQAALNTLLQQANQTAWRADRPITLAWISFNQNTNSPNPILSSNDQTPFIMQLQNNAQRLGLPLILPAMDLQDQNYVNDQSQLPFDTQKLTAAGQRYHVNAILAGNISGAVDGSWQGQWMFILDNQPHQWNTVGATPQAVMNAAMENMDGVMSHALVLHDDAAPTTHLMVQVMGVNTLDDYALVMNDFKQLSVVAHRGVAQLNGATLSLQLDVVGGKEALVAALRRHTDFTLSSPPATTTADNTDLFYQFQPAAHSDDGGTS